MLEYYGLSSIVGSVPVDGQRFEDPYSLPLHSEMSSYPVSPCLQFAYRLEMHAQCIKTFYLR